MEAKDTIMTRDNIGLTISEIGKEGTTAQRTYAFCTAVARIQAEITWDIAFKAGQEQGYNDGLGEGLKRVRQAKQAGIEEVVKFLENNRSKDFANIYLFLEELKKRRIGGIDGDKG